MDPKNLQAWLKLILTLGSVIVAGTVWTERVTDGLQDLTRAHESRVEEVDSEHERFQEQHEDLRETADRALYIACLSWDGPLDQCLPRSGE